MGNQNIFFAVPAETSLFTAPAVFRRHPSATFIPLVKTESVTMASSARSYDTVTHAVCGFCSTRTLDTLPTARSGDWNSKTHDRIFFISSPFVYSSVS